MTGKAGKNPKSGRLGTSASGLLPSLGGNLRFLGFGQLPGSFLVEVYGHNRGNAPADGPGTPDAQMGRRRMDSTLASTTRRIRSVKVAIMKCFIMPRAPQHAVGNQLGGDDQSRTARGSAGRLNARLSMRRAGGIVHEERDQQRTACPASTAPISGTHSIHTSFTPGPEALADAHQLAPRPDSERCNWKCRCPGVVKEVMTRLFSFTAAE